MNQPAIQRKQILKVVLGNRNVSSADVREIRLEPGQQSGRHLHPCAVLGYIVAGTAVYQVEGQAEEILPAGSAFYEAANSVIANFWQCVRYRGNGFCGFLLARREQELIRVLP
jgi:quercetin dioxygenase-like cupin family protein